MNPKGQSMDPGKCGTTLRTYWCGPGAKEGYRIAEQSAVFYGVGRDDANDTPKMEQILGEVVGGGWWVVLAVGERICIMLCSLSRLVFRLSYV